MSSQNGMQQRFIAQQCAGFSVRRAARAVANLFDDSFSKVGLKGTQFSLLTAIAIAEPAPIHRVAEALLMDRTTLTRNLKPLETQGFIETIRGQDKRNRLLRLTRKGRNKWQQAVPHWEQAQKQVQGLLGSQRLKRLQLDLKELEKLNPKS